MPTQTFYPDPDSGGESVDGHIRRQQAGGELWADIHDDPDGQLVRKSSDNLYLHLYAIDDTPVMFYRLYRVFALFDTSPLAGFSVVSAKLRFYLRSWSEINPARWTAARYINVYGSSPASDNDLVLGDYDQVGTVAFSTPKVRTTDTNVWIEFELNPAGIAAIDVDGVSKFSLRFVCDADDSEPGITHTGNPESAISMASADADEHHPELVITYGAVAPTPPDPGASVEAKAEALDSTGFTTYVDDIILVKNVP